MYEPEGSHRTRSKAAPDWTVAESLILVGEIGAVESEWGSTLPTFQKWQQIVENCTSLGVNRSLNQCRRHWEALLDIYRGRSKLDAAPDLSFPLELFDAIDRCVGGVRVKQKSSSGGEEAVEDEKAVEEVKEEEQVAMEADTDSDADVPARVSQLFFQTGSKSQKRRMKRQNRRLETQNPWGYFTSTKIKQEESGDINRKVQAPNTTISTVPEESAETKEQSMAKILHKNALRIHAILEGQLTDNIDHKLADLKNAEAVQTDFARCQGDKLIDCLCKISATLNQLCDSIQHCNSF